MSDLPGLWALRIGTPIGTLRAEMTFTEDRGGLSGHASGVGETVQLHDVMSVTRSDGEHVTWTQTITRPIRLRLAFDVVVAGDQMNGVSRAGRLPRSTVIGRRVSVEPTT